MKKRIDIQGISTTAAYQDGDCSHLTNLRKKNGVLRPVTPRKVVRTLNSAYSYQFIHNLPQGGENLLAVRTIAAHDNTYNYRGAWSSVTTYNANDAVLYNSAYYYLSTGTTINTPPGYGNWVKITNPTEISGSNLIEHVSSFTGLYKIESNNAETLIMQTTALKSITQLGNILNIIDAQNIKYIFWVEDQYKIIDSDFGGNQTDNVLGPVKVDLKVDVDTDESGYIKIRTYQSDTVGSTLGETDKELLASSLMQKAISINKKDGLIHGFIFACTALELYDGSYILHSNPILLNQSYDKGSRYNFEWFGTQLNYIDNKPTFSTYEGQIERTDVNSDGYYEETSHNVYNDNVSEPDIYDGLFVWLNGTETNSSTSMNFPCITSFRWDLETKRIKVPTVSNKLKFKINNNIAESLKPIVKSVSVFITKEISMYNFDKMETTSSAYQNKLQTYHPSVKTNAEIIKELSDNQQFYKVHEISFDDLQTITPETWIEIDLKNKLGENLVMQEELPVDNFTHHNILPEKQLVYNSKLHVMDYKQELFRGWPVSYHMPYTGIGQFQSNISEITSFNVEQWSVVDIKTLLGTSRVIKKSNLITPFNYTTQYNFISYPDSRAFKLTIYTKKTFLDDNSIYYFKTEYTLKSSDSHNYSYWISSELKPESSGIEITDFTNIIKELSRTLVYRNTMKVSAVNNPFYYPADTTYTIGTGIIRASGTNALRMSEGQFGQYDLYLLTTEGTYSFDTGTEISYNRKSPASLIIPTSDIICSTPYGIIFIGERGAYILSGQQPELISAQIEEIDGETDFISFLENLKDILFDAKQDEIIFVGPTEHWVYNLASKSWYTSTETIDYEIKNSYQLMVAAGTAQKQYNLSETNIAAVVIATRPIYFGVDEVKKLQRAVLRGRFMYLNTSAFDEEAFLQLHGLRDGIETTMLRGYNIPSNKQDRSYKDFDLGMMARANYRSYILKLQGSMDEKSQIEYIDFEVADPLNNDKMR